MTTQITLVGLGHRGTALGLALKGQTRNLTLVGHDREPTTAKTAQAKGAVDRIEWNLPKACEKADLIVLATPLPGVREALSVGAEAFRANCVVTSLAPLLGPPLTWAEEFLPADVHFVAGNLVANPEALPDARGESDDARPNLFTKALWAIAPAPNCAPAAAKLVADLAALLGASPFFIDPAEHDGLSAGVDAAPALTAVALLRAVTGMPGWRERRKLADRDFAAVTAPASADPAGRRATLDLNRENTLRYLDAVIGELTQFREAIAKGEVEALEKLLTEAQAARAQWLAERLTGDWRLIESPISEMPERRDILGTLLGFRKRSEPAKKK